MINDEIDLIIVLNGNSPKLLSLSSGDTQYTVCSELHNNKFSGC